MPENEAPQDKSKRKFNQEHYDMLIRCSNARDMTEWNDWRKRNRGIIPYLERAYLVSANLQGAYLEDANLEGAILGAANLQEANLRSANLQGAYLEDAELEGANLGSAKLQGAYLEGAKLQGADMVVAKLQGAYLEDAKLQGADLRSAKLQGAYLEDAKLQGAGLVGTELQGAILWEAKLQGADFENAMVDASTLIYNCSIDRDTYFGGVGLASARIQPGLRVSLEGNIRRIEWGKWYKKHKYLRWPVSLFWWVSDYGMSTTRLMGTFFGLAFIFGLIYYLFPSLVRNLDSIPGALGEPSISISLSDRFVRAMYFSVVTMTTLGFGDIFANPHSKGGHFLLGFQVLLGYGLLGALITRLGILFQSLGPAQDYSPSEKQEDKQQ
jgi:hypothetical protein